MTFRKTVALSTAQLNIKTLYGRSVEFCNVKLVVYRITTVHQSIT
jgi:hypothetical protein